MAPKFYEAPKFYPTHRDMAGPFEKYIESIEDELAEFGLGIIVPPRGWKPTSAKYETMNFDIPKPIRQHVTGSKGIYQSVHVESKGISLQEFKAMATLKENMAPIQVDTLGPEHDDLERHFWKNVTHFPPLYGADSEGSLFDPDHKGWNIRDLDTCLSRTLKEHGVSLPGVTTPYLYVGMWRSMFAWHTEDVDLYSMNYLHFGEPKSWYCIPPALRGRFERVVEGLMPEFHRNCPEFLRHKETLVTPFLIQQHSIPLVKAVQTPGQWVINFPSAYHSGFNHGFNCAESTNFATRRWVEYGAKAKACQCSGESVRIDMRLFGVEPPPVKIKPGALLLAPPLPPPDLTGATLPLVHQGKMVRRKALLPAGATADSPENAAKKSPSKAPLSASPLTEAPPAAKKRQSAGDAPKKSHKKQKTVQAPPATVEIAPALLAPGLEPLPAPAPPKKRKTAGGSSKKGGQAALAGVELAPFAAGSEGPQAGAKSKGSKPKAPKAQGKKGNGAQVMPLETVPLPVVPNGGVESVAGAILAVYKGPKSKKAASPKQKAPKAGAKRQKGQSGAVGALPAAPLVAPGISPLAVGSDAVLPQAIGQPAPKPKKSKAKAAKPAGAVKGGAVNMHAGAKSKPQPLVAPGGLATKAQAPKILRIKFNPPAALAIPVLSEVAQAAKTAPPAETVPPRTAEAAAARTKPQEGLDPGGGASPPGKSVALLLTPVPVPKAQPDSAGASDRVQTRRGVVLEEPLAVLFKDPPTGTKLQGRKRVRDGEESQAVGSEAGRVKSRDATGGKSKKKKKGSKKGGGRAVMLEVVGPVAGLASAAENTDGSAAVRGSVVSGTGEQASAPVVGPTATRGAVSGFDAPPSGSAEETHGAPSQGQPSTPLGTETVFTPDAPVSAAVPGEETVTHFDERLGGSSEAPLRTNGQMGSLSAEGQGGLLMLSTSTADINGVAREAGPSEPPPLAAVPRSCPAISGAPGGDPLGKGMAGAGGPDATRGNEPAAQGPLPKLVSPKPKKGKKKKGGSRKGVADPASSAGVTPAAGATSPKPRQRRRGPPPVERPGTHQMLRRSARGGPGEESKTEPAEAEKPTLSSNAAAPDAAATREAGENSKVETGGGVFKGAGDEGQLPPGTVFVPKEPAPDQLEKSEPREGPAERLKGGFAPEMSGAVSGGSQSQGQGPPRPESSGRLIMKVEGCRLVLRRVKQKEGSAVQEGKGMQGQARIEPDRACDGLQTECVTSQKGVEGALPEPNAPVLRDCLDEDVERPVQAASGDRAPTHRCPVEPTFADKSEACNELALSEVTVLTNCDPESDIPVEFAQASLRPVPKAGDAEETMDTSSQDSLSLTYHGEHGQEVIK